jgi:2-haloacid dehalogenase
MTTDNQAKLLLFDVYGTLLDLNDIKRKVNRILDSKKGYILWSEILLHYCMVDNSTTHHSFKDIARASLQMTAATLDVAYSDDSFNELFEMYKHLPLQEGAPEGLSQLKDKNFRFAALTNFPLQIVNERMDRTGLISYFEHIFSAEDIGKFKPDKATYKFVEKETGINASDILMITSHGWDIAGAMHSEMQAAYIEKGGEILYPLTPNPRYVAKNLTNLASQLNAADQ